MDTLSDFDLNADGTQPSLVRFFGIPVVTACAVFGLAVPVLAQDWPQWRGENRDARVAGFVAPKTWPQQLEQIWKVPAGQADATPALAGRRLYVFSRNETNEVLQCLEADTGKQIWSDSYPAQPATDPAQDHPGPRSSPIVAEGKVVTLGVRGTLSCWDANTGRLLWRKDEFPGWPAFFTSMSPVVIDGLCIAHLGEKTGGTIVAYNLSTGQKKWAWTGDTPAYASPAVLTIGGEKLLAIETERKLMLMKVADGTVLWQTAFMAQGWSYNAATPVVNGDTLIYCAQGRGTTAVKVQTQGDAFVVTQLWKNTQNSPQFCTPVVKDNLLFGLSSHGDFYCIDARNGHTLWTEENGDHGAFGAIVDAGSVLLALTPKSQLMVLEPSNKHFHLIASIKVADTPVLSYPVLSGNHLYIEDQNSVTLWKIE